MDLITRAKNAAHFNPSARTVINDLISHIKRLNILVDGANAKKELSRKAVTDKLLNEGSSKAKPKAKAKK